MLQKAVALLVYKIFVFELASSCGSIFIKVLLGVFGVFLEVLSFFLLFQWYMGVFYNASQ